MLKKRVSLFLGGALFFSLLIGCSSEKATAPEPAPAPAPIVITEEKPVPIVVHGDTVAGAGCVLQNRFQHGDKIVFRANVTDSLTTEQLENATMKLVFDTGEEFDMRYGPHGQKETMLWTVSYVVPDDAPTGTIEYKYVAEFDGQTAEFRPFDVAPTLLTIVEPEPAEEGEAKPEGTQG